MPARPDRALQVRTVDRLRASLARDEWSGRPAIGGLSEADQRELREVGGGRLAAIVFCVAWVVDAASYPRAVHEMQGLVMREVARLVDEQVRRTDLLGSLREDALAIFAPALDRVSGLGLVKRLEAAFTDRHLQFDDVQVKLSVRVGIATRSAGSAAGWTTQTLAEEAERNASSLPPIASVA